jgi:hypothetical protein
MTCRTIILSTVLGSIGCIALVLAIFFLARYCMVRQPIGGDLPLEETTNDASYNRPEKPLPRVSLHMAFVVAYTYSPAFPLVEAASPSPSDTAFPTAATTANARSRVYPQPPICLVLCAAGFAPHRASTRGNRSAAVGGAAAYTATSHGPARGTPLLTAAGVGRGCKQLRIIHASRFARACARTPAHVEPAPELGRIDVSAFSI